MVHFHISARLSSLSGSTHSWVVSYYVSLTFYYRNETPPQPMPFPFPLDIDFLILPGHLFCGMSRLFLGMCNNFLMVSFNLSLCPLCFLWSGNLVWRLDSIQVPCFWQQCFLVDAVYFALEHVRKRKVWFHCPVWASLITWLRWCPPYLSFAKGHFTLCMVSKQSVGWHLGTSCFPTGFPVGLASIPVRTRYYIGVWKMVIF